MRKYLFFLLFAIVANTGTLLAWDYERVQIGDLYYNMDEYNQVAEVTYQYYWHSYNYSGLNTITIPATIDYNEQEYRVTSIGECAFCYCYSLENLTISENVMNVGNYAFAYCYNLTSITNHATTPQFISSDVFSDVNIYACTLYVPTESIDLYRESETWNGFENILPIDNGCTIASGSFGNLLDNLVWELSCDSVLTITGTGMMGDWSSILSRPWYYYTENIKSVVIGDGVTDIANFAFCSCSNLKEISIPNSVTSIRQQSFQGCTNLKWVDIPNGVTRIEYGAFSGSSSLTSVYIPQSVTDIGDDAFAECSSLLKVANYSTTPQSISPLVFREVDKSICTLYVPEESIALYSATGEWNAFQNIVSIDEFLKHIQIGELYYNLDAETQTAEVTYMYYVDSDGQINYSSLSNVVIPGFVLYHGKQYTVTSIGERALSACSNLTHVSIPESITSIGQNALSMNPDLTNVTIPNSVTTIGSNVLSNCPSVTSVIIPASVTKIGEKVGDEQIRNIILDSPNVTSLSVEAGNSVYDSRGNCNAIIETATNTLIMGCQNTTIPNTVDTIGLGAFYGCTNLTTLNIPTTVNYVAEAAFHNIGISSIFLSKHTTIADGENGLYWIRGVFSECNNLTSVVFEEGITDIPYAVLSNCSNLKEVSIPEGVTRIGGTAFYECTNLTSVTIPKSVTHIGDNAFTMCTGLTSVIIPNSVTSIGYGAFSRCTGFTSVTIPNSVTSIGGWAFSNCTGLASVTNYATTPQSINSNVFSGVEKSTCKLYVPAESVSAYQSAEIWRDFSISGVAMTSKADPDNASAFYTTFYHSTQKYKLPAGMEAYTATINGEVLELTKVAEGGDVIPADEAFILKSNAANLTMDITEEAPVSIGENILQGVDVATSAPANCYVLSGKSSDNSVKGIGFYRFSGTLGAHKAYLVLAPKAGAPRRLRFAFSETNATTAIEDVQREDKGEWRKVLRDGQLYIIHEGQMYDARGSRVQ